IAGRSIAEVTSYSVLVARDFFEALEQRRPAVDERRNGHEPAPNGRSKSKSRSKKAAKEDLYAAERDWVLSDREFTIARQILKEIRERLRFLIDVGLDYLTLNRTASTLSGGEAQRIRLATQIGSGLMGVLYILDEPSIGLHQRDNA